MIHTRKSSYRFSSAYINSFASSYRSYSFIGVFFFHLVLIMGSSGISLAVACVVCWCFCSMEASHVVYEDLQSISPTLVNDELKPVYHFRPPRHWINGSFSTLHVVLSLSDETNRPSYKKKENISALLFCTVYSPRFFSFPNVVTIDTFTGRGKQIQMVSSSYNPIRVRRAKYNFSSSPSPFP